jgi:hypothetical protein
MRFVFVLALIAGIVGVALAPGGSSPVSAASPKASLQVMKECSAYTGAAGDYCTITSSNLAAIAPGSRVYYDKAFNGHANALNSNVVLDAGAGNAAFGHCSVDGETGIGKCTFHGGTGTLSGFHAKVAVAAVGGPDWTWDGTYWFTP